MSKVQTISVISFLSFCFIVGCLVFARGFLLNRQTISHKTPGCLNNNNNNAPKTVHFHSSNNYRDELATGGTGGGAEVNLNAEVNPVMKNFNQDTYGENPNKKGGLQSNWCNPSPQFSKLVLVLVDALRFDFVRRMPFLSRILEKESSSSNKSSQRYSSCLFKFVADPPTTTMQRLKALMTGTMPTFIDASANFNR
jgi:hypothetical protein